MKKIILLIFALIVFGGPWPAFAGETLTLDQALALARSNNPQLQAVRKEVESFKGDTIQAGLTPNPTLELAQEGTSSFGSREGNRSIFLNQELELGGKRLARLQVAEAAYRQAQWSGRSFARNLYFQVTRRFYATWVSQEKLATINKILARQEAFLDLNGKREKLGEISGLELNLMRAEYLRTEQRAENARKELQVNRAHLAQLIGLSPDKAYALNQEEENLPALPGLSVLTEEALQNRADLRAAEAGVQKAGDQIRLEQAAAVPNVTVGAGLTWDKLFIEGDEIVPAGILSRIQDSQQLLQVKVSVPLPIFNRNQGNVLKAEKLREAARLNAESTKRAIQTEVAAAWESVQADQKTDTRFRQDLLPTAESNLKTVEKAYGLGGESILAVIEAERTFLQTRLDYLDNLQALENDFVSLKAAVGKPDKGEDWL